MNEEVQKQVLARLDVIGAKLGVAAAQLWALFVRQSYIDGIEQLVLLAAALYITPWVMRRAKSMSARDMDYYQVNVAGPVLWAIYGILLILSAVFAVGAIDNLANPQLAAFKAIVSSVKQ